MTYTFDPHLSTDRDLVRFHIGDTHAEGCYLQDETIDALITSEGSMAKAVLVCIRHIITQLSQPDFRKDWLSVSNKAAREGYETLLREKAQELGVRLSQATAAASVSKPYRADSYQDDSAYDGSP